MSNVIDHLSLGVPNIEIASEFYDGLLKTLGVDRLAITPSFAAYGRETVQFLIMIPENGELPTPGNGTHICLTASDSSAVDQFHTYAVSNGGTCAGAPGPRPEYPLPNVYTAFVLDPYGNKLEAIYNGFAA